MITELSPIDYYFYRPNGLYTIQYAFEFQKKVSIEKIQNGISNLLKVMPVLGSRIVRISDEKLILKSGLKIPVREQVIMEEMSKNHEALFDKVENKEEEPLIKILITHSKKSSFVGVSFSHILGDGASFFIFIDHLSKIILSKEITISNIGTRSDLTSLVGPSKCVDFFEATGYIRPRPPSPNHGRVEYISYSFAELQAMKKACEADGFSFSNNVIIMADLIKKFHSSIPTFNNKLIVRCPVDYRKIIGLNDHFFGNAVRDAITYFDPEEIKTMELSLISKRIQNSIKNIDYESVQNSLTALDKFRIINGVNAFEDLGCPGLLVSNLSKFPVSKIDLGEGPPCHFLQASLNPRVALILPANDGLIVKFQRP